MRGGELVDTSLIVAVLDANVLYPRYVRDTLLRMAEADLYSARWSADILAELSRNLLKRPCDSGAG